LKIENLKKVSGVVDPIQVVNNLSTDELLLLLDKQAAGELTDSRIEADLYSVLLGINENYIDRNLLDLSVKNDTAIKALYDLRHEQMIYKMNLMKQQLTLKSILEQQLKTQQMTKIRLAELLKSYEQKLVVLINNYKNKLRDLSRVSTSLNSSISSQLLSSNSTGSKYLLDQSIISPLAYQALTSIQSGNDKINLNLPTFTQSIQSPSLTTSSLLSNNSQSLFTIAPLTAGVQTATKTQYVSPRLSAQNKIKQMNLSSKSLSSLQSSALQQGSTLSPRVTLRPVAMSAGNRSKSLNIGRSRTAVAVPKEVSKKKLSAIKNSLQVSKSGIKPSLNIKASITQSAKKSPQK
jgi:hypothetical protein